MNPALTLVLCLACSAGPLAALDLVDDHRYREKVVQAESALAQASGLQARTLATFELASACFQNRQYDRFAELYESMLPRYAEASWVHANLSVAYGKLGRYEEALQAADRAIRLDPAGFHARIVKASWLHRSGQARAATALVAGVAAPVGEGLAFYHACMACYSADAGDVEALERHIDRALELGHDDTFFRRDAVFDPYRDEAWYRERFGETVVPGEA